MEQVPRRPGADDSGDGDRIDRLAAEQHMAAGAEGVGNFPGDEVEQRRGQEQRGHALGGDRRGKRTRSDRRRLCDRHEPRAVQQRAPEFERRRVEGRVRDLGDRVVRSELCAVGAAHEAQHGAVRDHHAFRRSGRSRCVDHVSRVARARDGFQRVSGEGADAFRIALGSYDAHVARGEHRGERVVGDHVGDFRVGKHEREALARDLGIDRQVGRSDLQHREPRNRDVRTLPPRDRDDGAGRHTLGQQLPRQPIGGGLEAGIVERFDRAGAPRLSCALRETLGNRGRRGVFVSRSNRRRRDPLAGRVVHQRQRCHRLCRICAHRRHERRVLPTHAFDRRALEEVRAIRPVRIDPVRPFDQREGEVELRLLDGDRDRMHFGARELQLDGVAVPHREGDLEQRIARRIARHAETVDQRRERQLLALDRLEHPVPGPVQQFHRRRRAGQVGAEHHRVGEEADHFSQLRHRTAGDGRSYRQILVTGQARQQRGKRGEECDERCRALLASERLEGRHRCARQARRHPAAAEALLGRPAKVGGQREDRKVGEARFPERQLLCLPDAAMLPFLPYRVIGVIDRQCGERGIGPRARGGVGGGQVLVHRLRRDAVAEDVVPDAQQRVAAGREFEQRPAQWRGRREIEGPQRSLAHGLLQPPLLVLRCRVESDDFEFDERDRVDHLLRHRGDRHKARAQHRLPNRDRRECRAQCLHVECTIDAPQSRLMVGRAGRIETLQKPDASLRARERYVGSGGAARDRRHA